MPDIMIEVWDATGNKRQQVEVPVDSEVIGSESRDCRSGRPHDAATP